MNYTRNTDSKNRKKAPIHVTLWVDSKWDGTSDTISTMGRVELKNKLIDIADGEETHDDGLEQLSLMRAVEAGVFTQEQAETFIEMFHTFIGSKDFVDDTLKETTEEV